MKYLDYLNQNYFKEKGFIKIKSKLDKIEIDKTILRQTPWQKLKLKLFKNFTIFIRMVYRKN
jgi:hypothetical protein|tara:strand:- start:242 stop:427 length:186 start_codon:yes stop_codon:yes gene_type:complete